MTQPFTAENFLAVVAADSPANIAQLTQWDRSKNASANIQQWIKEGQIKLEEHEGLLEFAAKYKALSIGAGIFNGILKTYEEDPVELRAQLMRRAADGRTPDAQFDAAGQPDLANAIRDFSADAAIELALGSKERYEDFKKNASRMDPKLLRTTRAAATDPERKNHFGLTPLENARGGNGIIPAEVAIFCLAEKYRQNPEKLRAALTYSSDGVPPERKCRERGTPELVALADKIKYAYDRTLLQAPIHGESKLVKMDFRDALSQEFTLKRAPTFNK